MRCLTGTLFMMMAALHSYAAETPQHFIVDRGSVKIEVLAQGKGPVLLILPSRGRGAEDYDQVAPLIVSLIHI